MGSLELVTAPASEPVSRDELKLHAKIEVVEDDALVDDLITGAREAVERITGRALITQTWQLVLDRWPGTKCDDWWEGVREGALSELDADSVEIRKSPFITVTKVETVAEDGTKTEWDSANYFSQTESTFGRLVKKAGQTWPLIVSPVKQRGGIIITFTAGYGTTSSSVPVALRQAVKMLATQAYEQRVPVDGLPMPAVLNQYMVRR